ncbi:amidohydrolase [Enterococcus avium]|uniref:amidohydrolase n=1 Tax=Enterococcus avium TaxID=33945 RepID=UPI0028923FE1|nr:amidohydrolase [Enterococcus avium]MDT2485069.1 amidohydrolase [Enterococcus avium]MDT2511427.1 amidohydrolase [Enterococcus avium]
MVFNIDQAVEEIYPKAVNLRHYLHENPEESSKEFNTSKLLKQKARDLGLLVEELSPTDKTPQIDSAGTGFIATLDTGRAGKTIGLRTDIDALPILENQQNLKYDRSIISKNSGVMHACAHDGHMATVVSAMELLVSIKAQLKGKIIFIFEEGEENNTGIWPMIELLKIKNIDAIYGNHLTSFLETGKIAADAGSVTSSTARVRMFVHGRGGHASRPDKSINPIFAAANIVTNLASAWVNQLDIEKTITLGITQFQAGEARNVFPDSAYIGGTLRYFDERIGEDASNVIRNVAKNVAAAHLCTVEFPEDFGPSTPSVVNDPELSKIVQDFVESQYPNSLLKDVKWFASETFSRYRTVAPCVFVFHGISNHQIGSGAEHHNEKFDMDDNALKYSIGTMVGFAIKMLS